jgi:gas vesicle protein
MIKNYLGGHYIMELLSTNEIEKQLDAKEKGFTSLNSVDDILLSLLLIKKGVPMTAQLSKKVKKNTEFEIPTIEGLVSKEDEEHKTYDIELLKLTAFLIAQKRGDENVKVIEEQYSEFKSMMDNLYEDYAEDAAVTLNEVIEKAEKIEKLDKLDV